MTKIFVLFLLFLATAMTARSQVVISEIMQSNIDCVMDDRNEFPDSWVELYNTTDQSISLKDYSIGLTPNPAEAWKLPNAAIPRLGYTLVYCDKADTGLHTDFRLESGKGGAVYLFCKGKIASSVVDIPKQPTPGIAYACYTDGAPDWAYASAPTPKAPNTSPRSKGLLPQPIFSIDAGVYNSQKILELTIPDDAPAGSVIRYTKDGSEPTASSPLYSQPIAILHPTPVRAKLFCEGWASPRSVTQSYIIPDHRLTLPVVSIATDKKYLDDSIIGIFVSGSYNSSKKNYEYDWRRPLNIEIFEADGTTCPINQLCEGRVMGAASRGCQLKSMALYANKRFGAKRFDYEFFPDQRPGVTNYKSFLLRNAGNDFDYLYMRDAIIQRTVASHTDVDWQAWRPAVVYINGEYKGILNLRDRSNDDNIFTHYDGLDDIDIIKNNYELQHGTWDHYNAFKAFYTEHGHTWDEYARWMDLDEYIVVMVANLYYGNVDFPGNNIVMWRPRTEEGRWRIILKDTDYALGIYDGANTYNMMAWINNADYDGAHNWANQWDHTRLFRRLMEDMDFRRRFLERSAIYMGDFLNDTGTRATWDPMYQLIQEEYPYHRALINRWWPVYNDELSKARRWSSGRANYHYAHLAEQYNIGEPTPLRLNLSLSPAVRQGIRVVFNEVPLSEGTFNGNFFRGSEIHLSARPAVENDVEEYRRMKLCATGHLPSTFVSEPTPLAVTGWHVVTIGANGTQTVHDYDGPTLSLTMPQCACLQITAVTEEASSIPQVYADAQSASPQSLHIPLCDLQGRPTSGARPAGIYLQQQSDGGYHKVVLR